MKITSHTEIPSAPTPANAATTANAQKASQGAADTENATATSAGVSVSVSTLSRSLERPEPSTASEIDTAKVNAMKTAIQNGTYKVNPEAIADKLLSNAQEMLNPPRN